MEANNFDNALTRREEIKLLRQQGETYQQIADRFGITKQAVDYYIHHRPKRQTKKCPYCNTKIPENVTMCGVCSGKLKFLREIRWTILKIAELQEKGVKPNG